MMLSLVCLCLLWSLLLHSHKYLVVNSAVLIEPEEWMSFYELMAARGLRVLTYTVLSDDGQHVLRVYRVVWPQDYLHDRRRYNQMRKPVLLHHGVQQSGNAFFLNSPRPLNQSHSGHSGCSDNLGLCLLQSGRYDVWSINARGTHLSQARVGGRHRPEHSFWDFSFQQMAEYDLPAVIRLVRRVTGHRRMGYVGFSQGTTVVFALLSKQPHYAHVLCPVIALSPVVFLSHTEWPLLTGLICPLQSFWRSLAGPSPVGEPLTVASIRLTCRPIPPLAATACAAGMSFMYGRSNRLNQTRMSVYLRHLVEQAPTWSYVHMCQMRTTGRFVQFDFGSVRRNRLEYGQDRPPDYPLQAILPAAKIVVMYGATDVVLTPTDAMRLVSVLRATGASVINHPVPAYPFNHNDFLLGVGSGPLINDPILAYLDRFA